jgi:hypothetical protein
MAKKKTTRKKAPARKKTVRKVAPKRESHPEFMVQVNEPMMLRKDVLESLREVIIFMQGYEKFRAVQEEKVALFSVLQSNVKELKTLIDGKLRGYMPKGKLTAVTHQELVKAELKEDREEMVEIVPMKSAKAQPEEVKVDVTPQVIDSGPSDLDQLEDQLHDIENQLQNLQ